LRNPARQVRQRLAAERQAGLRHGFTRQGTHQRVVQRGKKWACGHAQGDRQWRSLRPPSAAAPAAPDVRTTPGAEPPLHGPTWAARSRAAPSESAAPLGRWRCVAGPYRVPLAKTPAETYKGWVRVHAFAASLLGQTGLPRSLPVAKIYEN